MENPFVYSRPVPPDQLIDRERDVVEVLDLARGGHNVRLTAPRRYGKTSLIARVRADAERDGTPTVYVNWYGILSLRDAAARVELAYEQLRGPLRNWIVGKLRTLRPRITVLGSSVELGGELESDEARRLLELLDLPRQIQQRAGERVLVFYDEFQEVLEPHAPLDGLIRSVIERHAAEAGYVFAGSHPGMMARLFGDRERPFYGQARPLTLGPLSDEDLAEHIGARFERGRRGPGAALRPLLEMARGHPQRAMMVAHHLWDQTPAGGEADEETFLIAIARVREELGEAFERAWRGLDDGERRALAATALSGGLPTRMPALEAVELARSTAQEALVRLRDQGQLVEHGGRWTFVDPLFEDWVVEGRGAAG